MFIRDGTGRGYVTEVTEGNRLAVDAKTSGGEAGRLAGEKKVWIVNTATTANTLTVTSTGGTIAVIENPAASQVTVVIDKVQVSVDTAGIVYVSAVGVTADDTPGNANTFAPVSTYASSALAPAAVEAYTWEETPHGMTNFASGTELTSAVLGVGVWTVEDGGVIVIPPGSGFGIQLKGACEAAVNIRFYEVTP